MSEKPDLPDRIAFHHEKMSENEQRIHSETAAEAADVISRMTVPLEARLKQAGMRPALARSLCHTVLLDGVTRVAVCSAKSNSGYTKEEWLKRIGDLWDRLDAVFYELDDDESVATLAN